MKSVFMAHTFVDLDFNLSYVCRLPGQTHCHAFTFPFFTTRRAEPAKDDREGVGSIRRQIDKSASLFI